MLSKSLHDWFTCSQETFQGGSSALEESFKTYFICTQFYSTKLILWTLSMLIRSVQYTLFMDFENTRQYNILIWKNKYKQL